MRIRVRAIGKGTENNPIKPDLDSINEIANLHKALDEIKQKGKNLNNLTFYTVQIISYNEKTQEFEVEINVNKDIIDVLPEPVKTAFNELCSLVKTSGT